MFWDLRAAQQGLWGQWLQEEGRGSEEGWLCWVLQPSHPLTSPAQGGTSCSHPRLVAHPPSCPCWAHSILWDMALASPRPGGVGWSSRAVLAVEEEAEPGGAQFPRARGPHSKAALAGGIREMAWAAGDLSWSLPTVTHTPHTWHRHQCWQCDCYWGTLSALWDPCIPQGRCHLLVSSSSRQRPGVGLARERLLCSPGYLWNNWDLAGEGDHSHSCSERRIRCGVNPFGSRGAVPAAALSLVGCARSNDFPMSMDPGWVSVPRVPTETPPALASPGKGRAQPGTGASCAHADPAAGVASHGDQMSVSC